MRRGCPLVHWVLTRPPRAVHGFQLALTLFLPATHAPHASMLRVFGGRGGVVRVMWQANNRTPLSCSIMTDSYVYKHFHTNT